MINKYVMTRTQNVNFVRENMETFIEDALYLSRYEENDPLRDVARRNFIETYEFILTHPEVENDYKCCVDIHSMLMRDLDNGVKSELNDEQIRSLSEMINTPAKANLEIAIDVMLFILSKRLFSDGDVRTAITFANKIMVDCGCGFITISPKNKELFRQKLHDFKDNKDTDIKDWVYKYCVKGMKKYDE